jgi:hypothetical protein
MTQNGANRSDSESTAEEFVGAAGGASTAKAPSLVARPFEVLTRLARRLGPVATAIVAIISTLSALITLIYFFRPAPPPVYADLIVESAEWPVTLREFEPTAVAILREIDASPTPFDEGLRNLSGAVIRYTAKIGGYEGKECRVRWSMTAQPGNRTLRDPNFTNQDAWPVGVLIPTRDGDQGSDLLWSPLPSEPGAYAAEVVLSCEGRELDRDRTREEITVER